MRSLGRVAITTALLVPLVAGPVAAQNYRWDLGVNGGFSWYRAMLGSDQTGLPDGSVADDVRFRAGWLAGAQLGVWFTPRVGVRANMTYTDRPLVGRNDLLGDNDPTGDRILEHINLWSGSGDLMIRLREPNMDWMGTEALPYLALGLGAKWVNPAGDNFVCVEPADAEQGECVPFQPGNTGTANTFALREGSSLMGLVGLGTDIRFRPNVALRLEVNDRIYKPQVYAANFTNNQWQINEEDNLSQTVHEVGAQIGLHLLMGVARPTVVTVAPAPLPPAEPVLTPQPEPPPPPREDAITVCVIDPTAPTGIRMQNALFLHDTRDTVVVQGAARVPLRTAVGSVMVARDADWYVRGQPLTMTIGNDRIEYLTYQGARQIEANRLSYLGTINGYPVYADRDEVADFVPQIETLRRDRPGSDLGVLLANNRPLRDRVEDVRLLYVPLEPTGCVFQTVQVMEQVRKGK